MDTLSDRTVVYENNTRSTGITASAVSWGAILGGAVAAAAMSLILFILGTGLGLTSVSPWSSEGLSAEAVGISAILWITFTSLVAAGLGGYLTGRLRTRWLDVPRDEVFFRDTAHGFLAWAVATLLTAALFTSVMASVIGTGARAGAAAAGGVADALTTTATAAAGAAGAGMLAMNEEEGTFGYYLDSLFRRDPAAAGASPAAQTPPAQATRQQADGENADADGEGGPANAVSQQNPVAGQDTGMEAGPALTEVSRIVTRALRNDGLAEDDLTYTAQLIAQYTGIGQDEAEERIRTAYENLSTELREMETAAREMADEARATSAYISLWFFIALLAGAFVGSYSATYGGRQRDL